MKNSKAVSQLPESFDDTPGASTESLNDDVRFWQSVSLSLAIFVLSLFASLVIALVLMLATR